MDARVRAGVKALEEDRIHGAAWIGEHALDVLERSLGSDVADAAVLHAEVLEAARALATARPSIVPLENAVAWVVHRLPAPEDHDLETLRTEGRALCREARDAMDEARRAATRRAAELVARREAVLTLSRSRTVVEALLEARPARVLVAESRPGGEGHDTAQELAGEGVNVDLLLDNRVGGAMAEGRVDAVLVGADSILRDGGVVNKVGTYQHAVLAHHHDVPFHAAADTWKVTPQETVPLEAAEVDGGPYVHAETPLFDRTPGGLVTSLATEEGALDPRDVEPLAQGWEAARSSLWHGVPRPDDGTR